jgi:hypothetical protein
MTKDYDPEGIARELLSVSPDVRDIYTFDDPKVDGRQDFRFDTTRRLTTDEMVLICREMAALIRRRIPERPDGWAAAIYPANGPGIPMGVYEIGWAGRPDEWRLSKGQERKATDHADWLALRDRLRVAVAALGTERDKAGGSGDFQVSEAEYGPRRQTLFVYNPEFLTKRLIAVIQNMLKSGHTDEVVRIRPSFGEAFDCLFDGLDVRADSVVERWERQDAEELLGDRLKI